MKTYKHPTKEIYYKVWYSKTLDKVFIRAFSPRKEYKVETIPLDAVKCSKNKFLEVKNKYFVSKRFEWVYQNEKYETCPLENTIEIEDVPYRYLVFNCGKVYKGYFRYDGRVYLDCGKWTSKKNCLGIRKIIEK